MATTGPWQVQCAERAVEAGVAHGVDPAVGRGQPVALVGQSVAAGLAAWATTTEFSGTVVGAATAGAPKPRTPPPA